MTSSEGQFQLLGVIFWFQGEGVTDGKLDGWVAYRLGAGDSQVLHGDSWDVFAICNLQPMDTHRLNQSKCLVKITKRRCHWRKTGWVSGRQYRLAATSSIAPPVEGSLLMRMLNSYNWKECQHDHYPHIYCQTTIISSWEGSIWLEARPPLVLAQLVGWCRTIHLGGAQQNPGGAAPSTKPTHWPSGKATEGKFLRHIISRKQVAKFYLFIQDNLAWWNSSLQSWHNRLKN